MQIDSITIDFRGFAETNMKPELDVSAKAKVRQLQSSQRYRYVTIDGLPCGSFTIRIDDDLEELLIALEQLEQQVTSGRFTTHTVFLNDGGFTMVAYMDPTNTKIDISRTPFLNRLLTKNYQVAVSTNNYVAAWRSVLQTVLSVQQAMANSLGDKRAWAKIQE